MKKLLKAISPPIILNIYLFLRKYLNKKAQSETNQYGWFGKYSSWSDAMEDCGDKGYASELILSKVKKSLLKVKKGEAVYERDSYLFDRIIYSWPLLAGLLWVAGNNQNKLHVLDFGGSLGSSYYQNRNFLSHCKELSWNIVEQKHFIECGRRNFQDKTIKFYDDIDSCLKENRKINILLLSGVVQYLKDPYAFLNKILSYRFQYIIFDRTVVFQNNEVIDRLTVQKVPPQIYKANYPCWIFNEKKFVKFFRVKYNLIADFTAHAGTNISLDDNIKAFYKGYIYEIKPIHNNPKL